MSIKKPHFDSLIYILFAVFYLWLAAQIPYTHDDWDWGLEIGMQQWLTASVNSRYVGNFFEIIMTRSVFLKTVIMGGTFFLLPFLLSSIAVKWSKTDKTKLLLFLAANFLILTMSRMIWSETYGWVAGFANFGLSSVFMILCVNQWLPLFEKNYQSRKQTTLINFLWMMIAFCGQLFIENLSLIMAAVSVLTCVVAYLRTKKVDSRYFFMSVGMLLGVCVMFSSSVYASLFGSGEAVDGYRQLIVSAEGGLVSKMFNIFVQAARLVTRAGEANFVLCISTLTILTYKIGSAREKRTSHKALIIGNAIFAVYFTVNFILQTDYTPDRILLSAFAAMVNGLYFLTVPLEIFIIYQNDSTSQQKLVSIWFFAILLLVPLVITNEAGYRLIFSLNITVTLFLLYILHDILSNISYKGSLKAAFLIATMLPTIAIAVVYSAIGECNRQRITLMEIAAFYDAQEITLPTYPYANYLHAPDPIDQTRMEFFKEFYGINGDVNVIFDTTE